MFCREYEARWIVSARDRREAPKWRTETFDNPDKIGYHQRKLS